MKTRSIRWVQIFIYLVCCLTPVVMAMLAFAEKEDCVDSLRIYETDAATLDAQAKASALDYYYCKSCLDNSLDACRHAGAEEVERCTYNFKLIQRFFLPLALNRSVNTEIISGCVESGFGSNQKWCKDFVSAFVNKDMSFCKTELGRMKESDCVAFVNLNEGGTGVAFYKDIILYIKAISSYDLKICKQISDKYFRTSCIVTISNDKKICKKTESFQYLKNRYCKEKKEGKKNEKK